MGGLNKARTSCLSKIALLSLKVIEKRFGLIAGSNEKNPKAMHKV